MAAETCFEDFYFKPLSSFSAPERQKILQDVKRIEKKVFPHSEAFDFDSELRKKNTILVVAVRKCQPLDVVAYLVSQRIRKIAWLHKICVIESERRKGLAKEMIQSLCTELKRGGCQIIHLWVDEARNPARSLYESCNFREIDRYADYYGPGRTALKMELTING